jgi:ABC-2 type transport system permease protein
MTAVVTTAAASVHPRPAADVITMLRRNLLRAVRYPGLTMFIVGAPLVLLLLFVYVFGGALGAGVAPGVTPGAQGRAAYLAYITPTLLILTVVGAGQSIAIGAAMDAAGGIMARFKTMAISPGSVLSGQVLGTVIQSLLATALVLGARSRWATGPPPTRSTGSRCSACSCCWGLRSAGCAWRWA